MARTTDRPARQHREVAREAGFQRVSFLSIFAGTLCAYGAFAMVAAIAGAILASADVDTDFTTNDWSSGELIGGVVTAAVLLVAYLFGGYVAGRMARRSGVLHGFGVFALSIIAGAVAGGLVSALADSSELEQNLGTIGVPTTWDEWSAVGMTAAALAIGAMLVGSVVGGLRGERWHTKLASRAADPSFGPAAGLRARAEHEDDRREERIAADPVLEQDVRSQQPGAEERRTVDVRDDADAPPVVQEPVDQPAPDRSF